MKEVFAFIQITLDRTQLWLWLTLAALIATVASFFLPAGGALLKEYGFIAFFCFAALLLQSAPVHGRMVAWATAWRHERAEKRARNERMRYLLAVPCKELVLLVAYYEFFGAVLANQSTVPLAVVRPMFFDEQNGPTRAALYLVEQKLAQLDTSSGHPLIHQWVYRAVHGQLALPKETECKRVLSRLQKHGFRLITATEWSALFVLSVHEEAMRLLDAEAT